MPPWDWEPTSGGITVDRVGERMFAENYTAYPGIGRFGGAWAIKGTTGVHFEPDRNHHGDEVIANLAGAQTDGPWAFIPRWIPPLMLLEAWEAGSHAKLLGSARRMGRRMHVVAFTQRDGTVIDLLLDAVSGTFVGFESKRDDGVYGDVTDRVEYSDWRSVGGVMFPSKRVDWFNAEVARKLDLVYAIDVSVADSQFELPPGYTRPSAANGGPRLQQIGEAAYLDTMIGGVMIVEFKEFLVVVDCPGDFGTSQATIDALRERFGGKPIKYVVPSHTHGDHGGGARGYFHAGATLITTPGHVGFYQELARVKRTISPDPYRPPEGGPQIEVFEGKHIISDGTQTMVFYDVGPNAHSEQLTIVHLPKQRIVWQADLHFTPMTGGIVAARPIAIDFAQKLKALGITDFDKMIEAHHSRAITSADFRRALALIGYTGY